MEVINIMKLTEKIPKTRSLRQQTVSKRNFRLGRIRYSCGNLYALLVECQHEGAIIKHNPNLSLLVEIFDKIVESAYQNQCKLYPKKTTLSTPT